MCQVEEFEEQNMLVNHIAMVSLSREFDLICLAQECLLCADILCGDHSLAGDS